MKPIFTFFATVLVVYNLYAQPGSLDKSFGQNGKTLSPFSFNCNTLALQADGKILAGGSGGAIKNGDGISYLLTRYNSDGTMDYNFGDNGRAILGINLGILYSLDTRGLAIQPDGKIIAAGRIATLPQQIDI